MRVLVTDSDTRPALAAVRAIGRQGHDVITAGVAHPSLASVSRFSQGFEKYPDPAVDTPGFVAALAGIVRRREVDVVLPITEITTLLVAEHRADLPAGCRVPLADHGAVASAANKARVIAIAEILGVPTPRTVVVEDEDAAAGAAKTLGYPLVVKPARSRIPHGPRWISTEVKYANDETGLAAILRQTAAAVYPVLLQEKIRGPGVGVFACFDKGRPVTFFAHRRLREKPPSGGVSVLCESTALDPAGVEYATLLLGHLGWHGVAMVEFKRDSRNGSLRLMEINGRFWGSLQLAIDAGIDFPSLAVDLASGRPVSAPVMYATGVRSRWLAGHTDVLVTTFLRHRQALNLPAGHPGRWQTLKEYVRLFGQDVRLEVERRDDPAPARLEWRRWLAALVRPRHQTRARPGGRP